jgi:hypothetical protein
VDTDGVLQEIRDLVDEVRTTCLWYLREDYYPRTREEALRVLEAIERGGDVGTFKHAARLREWLLQSSSDTSAGS